nr:hypothetical protein [Tanacetum cinerariifolium]
MGSSHFSVRSNVSNNSVSSDIVVESFVPSGTVLNAFTEEIVAYEKESDETHVVKKAGFVVRRSCQKRMLNEDVKQKYLVCSRMGCLKGIHLDTLDLGNNDKQKRNSNLHITGCKACHVFNLDTRTRKFLLNVFDTIHNHELEREEYKHLSKTYKQLTYMEQVFIVKATSVNIGTTRAHHLLTGIKGSYFIVHGTTVDLKNNFRSVKCYIGDGDAQMLIHKMENRKKHVYDFSFYYLGENAELSAIFWPDEVSKYNYREFGDVVSFDATFKTHKYKMVFVSFTVIDNHRKCVTIIEGLLKIIVVTDQDGATRNAIEAEFGRFKHRLYMWHITQKLPAMKQRHVQERMDHKIIDTVPKLKTIPKIEWHASDVYTRSEVCIIKESPYVYEMPNKKKKKPQSVDKGKDKAEENDIVDLFFKKMGFIRYVLWNIGDGSVVYLCQLFVRVGILCKHIFCVFKNANVKMIPQQYISRRWMKNLLPAALRNKRNRYGEKNVVVENYAIKETSIVDHCVHLLSKDEPRLCAFVEKLKSLKKEVEADYPNPPSKNKTDNLKQLVGVSKLPTVDVNNPTGRISCSLCGDTDHNKRTRPRRFEGQDEVVVQKEVCQEEVVVQKEACQEEVVQEKVDSAEDEEELFEEDEDFIRE